MAELPTGTVTFLFTDIEGSTRLLHELGDAYGDVLAEHRRLLRDAFAAHGGVEVDTQGDAFFVAFARATDAVAAAAGCPARPRLDSDAGADGDPHRRAAQNRRGLRRDGRSSRGAHRRCRARRPGAPLPDRARAGGGRPFLGVRAARPRRARAQGLDPSPADLPARRRRHRSRLPAAFHTREQTDEPSAAGDAADREGARARRGRGGARSNRCPSRSR